MKLKWIFNSKLQGCMMLSACSPCVYIGLSRYLVFAHTSNSCTCGYLVTLYWCVCDRLSLCARPVMDVAAPISQVLQVWWQDQGAGKRHRAFIVTSCYLSHLTVLQLVHGVRVFIAKWPQAPKTGIFIRRMSCEWAWAPPGARFLLHSFDLGKELNHCENCWQLTYFLTFLCV